MPAHPNISFAEQTFREFGLTGRRKTRFGEMKSNPNDTPQP